MVANEEQAKDWRKAWSIGLRGLNPNQIAKAVELCTKRHDWPPSPAEFRNLVEQEIDYETMFREAVNANATKRWPTKIIYWSAVSFNRYELERTFYRDVKERWKKTVDAIMEEEVLPDIPSAEMAALPKPGETFNRDIARAEIKKALAIVRQGA